MPPLDKKGREKIYSRQKLSSVPNLGVTEDCIRKDLRALEAEGRRKRVYDGVIGVGQLEADAVAQLETMGLQVS